MDTITFKGVHQAMLDRLQARIRAHPEMLALRKALSEHPFGTIKVAMNHERLLLKGLKHVATEIRLDGVELQLRKSALDNGRRDHDRKAETATGLRVKSNRQNILLAVFANSLLYLRRSLDEPRT